ncbi:MAG: non-canonical purine NTP pyrophosphatase, partial [Elusimicrobiota bacterium]
MKLLLATRNRNKVRELSCLLEDHGFSLELVSLEDFPAVPEVAEDGATLEQNACKKALFPALSTRFWTLADDTGLAVDALGGAPGVRSARWAGPDCSDADNCAKLLQELAG